MFSDKKKLKIKKEEYRVGTQDLLCKRQRIYHSATEPQATEQILILNPIHASVILRFSEFPKFTEFSESSAPFRENSIDSS